MRALDWIVLIVYLTWIVWSGLRASKRSTDVDGYLRANRSLPWWAVGLSVMATQLSAITLVGTTGQGYADGIRFVQFYLGLPIAMVILSMTLVPFFYRSGVYTAYEYLERRFDVKTRTLAAIVFLAQRGLSCGVIIAAPAIILSIVLGWNLVITILAIGLPTIAYTMFGGVQAVTWTDVKQMAVVLGAMTAAVVVLILGLPHDVSTSGALHVAGALGKLNAIDLKFDFKENLHNLVRSHRRRVSLAVVFRLRPEPGAAVFDGEVADTEPAVAAAERVRQDPAAGDDSDHGRPDVHVLSFIARPCSLIPSTSTRCWPALGRPNIKDSSASTRHGSKSVASRPSGWVRSITMRPRP